MSQVEAMEALGFKFVLGQIVATVGSATETECDRRFSALDGGHQRFLIVERTAQQCPGGVQLHYAARPVNPSGGSHKDYFRFHEIELEASEPFARRTDKKDAS